MVTYPFIFPIVNIIRLTELFYGETFRRWELKIALLRKQIFYLFILSTA